MSTAAQASANMQGIDWKIIISLLALFFSLASFYINIYFQQIRPPRIGMAFGTPLRLGLTKTKRLTLTLPVNFFNDGTRGAVIHFVKCTLKKNPKDEPTIELSWTHFTEQVTTRTEEDGWKTEQRILSRVQPVILEGTSIETRLVKFNSQNPAMLTPGVYQIEVKANNVTATKKFTSYASAQIVLTEDNVRFMKEECVTSEKKRGKGLYICSAKYGRYVD